MILGFNYCLRFVLMIYFIIAIEFLGKTLLLTYGQAQVLRPACSFQHH